MCHTKLGMRRGRVFLAKLDLQNAYWSIHLPVAWRRVFVVQGGSGRKFRYSRLPFGWSYSPAICQRLVQAIIRRVLSRHGVRGWVYLDDILISCQRRGRLRRASRDCKVRLRKAGFIVGSKSDTTPTECLGFIGKTLDTRVCTISNSVGALVGAFRAWVRGVGRGKLPTVALRRLLGKLCWLGRPNAGLGSFLAGAYRCLQRGLGHFNRGVAKGIATVLTFSCVPQRADVLGDRGAGTWEVFADAAPKGDRFRIGIVGEKGFCRSSICPEWVTSLQQAKLFAVYAVAKLASYRGFTSVRIGSDSNVARAQINSLRACVCAGPQQRILRRLFWLRCWSGCSISSFRVRSAINLADPLSRVVSFQSRAQAVADAEARRVMWDKQTDGKYEGLAEMVRPAWRFVPVKGGVG